MIIRARPAIRDSDTGAPIAVRSERRENLRRACASGIAASTSRRSRNGVSARKIGPKIHGARR